MPYAVTDVYGTTVLPEDLGNPSEEPLNNHPARPASLIVDNAERNLAVHESTASFFLHPFFDSALLEEILDGITELGYEFVSVPELAGDFSEFGNTALTSPKSPISQTTSELLFHETI